MNPRIRQIRIYKCGNAKCSSVIHDHAEPGGVFADMNCPKCGTPMSHSTELYQVTHPEGRPHLRICTRIAA